jgi:hypothetical protein
LKIIGILGSTLSRNPATKNQDNDQYYYRCETTDKYTYKPPVDFKTGGYIFIAVQNDKYRIIHARELCPPAIEGVPERRDRFKGNDSSLAVTLCIWERPGFRKIDFHGTTAGADIHGQIERIPWSGCFRRFRRGHCYSH